MKYQSNQNHTNSLPCKLICEFFFATIYSLFENIFPNPPITNAGTVINNKFIVDKIEHYRIRMICEFGKLYIFDVERRLNISYIKFDTNVPVFAIDIMNNSY